ncbi:MAG: hypothetical protein MI810_18295 [Flavobacteriales bacterium]|nr:hypothetical protein [Flavobacteriales bacterium]
MEQRDLIKDQIEQLGKVLAKMLSDFLGLKSEGKLSEGIESTNYRLQTELDIDIHQLLNFTKEELKNFFANRQHTPEHLETLSDYLKEAGIAELELNEGGKSKMYFQKAIELLEIANENSQTMSFERMTKQAEIEKLL